MKLKAFTLVEVVIALTIMTIAFGGIFLINGHILQYVKSTRYAYSSSASIQERIEAMRVSNWKNMTNSSWLKNTLLNKKTKSSAGLGRITETVKVSPYPANSSDVPIIVERSNSGLVSIISNGSIGTARLARVDLTIKWFGFDGRQRTKQASSIISNSGISAINLAAGPSNSVPPTGTTGTTTTGTTSTGTTTSGTTTTGTTTTGTTTSGTTTSGNNGNGNGNGRGNVGNGNGQK